MTEKERCRQGLLYNHDYEPELQRAMLQAADPCPAKILKTP